jgi:hypothetical protein
MHYQDSPEQEFIQLLEGFLTETIAKINVDTSTPEKNQVLRELIKEKIDRRIHALIVDELPEEEFQQLVADLDGGNLTEDQEETLFAQAASQIPDFAEKFAEALQEVQTAILRDIDDLRQLQ